MKIIHKAIFTISSLLILSSAYSQGTSTKGSAKKSTAAGGNPVAIKLKNLCEKSVTVFAGHKTELKNPKAKQKVYGGLSTNTINVNMNDVVCIINAQEKPASCVDVKTGKTQIEINTSGTVITAK